jgi:hypothetical protein
MSSHRTTVVGDEGAWQAKCTCKRRSPVYDHEWKADDWNRLHLRAVERANLHPRGGPTLKDQRDWYQTQADRATDKATREQWLQLAEGLDHRIGTVPQHDDSLW